VAAVDGLQQRICDPSPRPEHRGLLDSELLGVGVGGLEPDAVDVPGKAVGVLCDQGDGVRTVGLINTDGPSGADSMALQEDNDLPDDLLLRPAGYDALDLDKADARELGETATRMVKNHNGLLVKKQQGVIAMQGNPGPFLVCSAPFRSRA